MRPTSGWILSLLVAAAQGAAAGSTPDPAPKFAPVGVYGRVDLSRFIEDPIVLNDKPITIDRPLAARRGQRNREPVYLWIPRAYYSEWDRYCDRYKACAEPVYFIDHDWYYHIGPGRGLPHREKERRDHAH